MQTETPDQPSLYAALDTPVAVEIVVSKELTALISNPNTAQYLQGAEMLGAIPGGKPAGAWARVIGLSLLSFWRRKPRETINGTLKPTRRELLEHFPAKVSPHDEILNSNNPMRAITYWCDALRSLVEAGFIEKSGEATIKAKDMRNKLPRQGWKSSWLDQSVDIEPSHKKMKIEVESRAKALPAEKPRDLTAKPRTRKR